MRSRAGQQFPVSLFPFLSVLLCTMGILAFMAISFMLTEGEPTEVQEVRKVEFQWVGAPAYVKPVYVRCYEDKLVYYHLFYDVERTVYLSELLDEIQTGEGRMFNYLQRLALLNKKIKHSFGKTEHYPLLLVYPDAGLSAELLALMIHSIEGLTFGMEPMLSHWEVPYQSLSGSF